MKILKPNPSENAEWVLMDVCCPICYPHCDCGMVDGGAVSDGDLVEFHHRDCGYTWEVLITLTQPPEPSPKTYEIRPW